MTLPVRRRCPAGGGMAQASEALAQAGEPDEKFEV